MSTKNELRDQVLAEMNARRIDHKTYINSEWLLSEYETTLRKEQEEAYTKGYNAGLADGTGKPLLAIEQIREEAVKAERERIREAFKSECQKNLKEYGGAFVSYQFEPKYLTSQNTKTDSPQNYWDTHTVDGVIESIETLKKGIPDTTNSDKRDEDQHREQCEGRY